MGLLTDAWCTAILMKFGVVHLRKRAATPVLPALGEVDEHEPKQLVSCAEGASPGVDFFHHLHQVPDLVTDVVRPADE